MTRDEYPFGRRTVLKTIGASTVATGALAGVAAAHNCDATVSPGDSIQTTVNNASSGETICIEAGTYDENVTVDVENLTLHGPNAGLSGSDSSRGSEAVVTDGIVVDADGVTVKGLQVESNGFHGIRLQNPVDGTTILNNVITNVDGGTFSNEGAGNGVQIQLTGDENETANNLSVRNNKISNVTTPDLDPGGGPTLAIGVNVLPRGNDVDLVVDGNEITDIEPGEAGDGDSREARAVSVDTQLDNGVNGGGRVDGVEITNNDISNIAGDRLFAVSLFEDGGVDPRRGVEDFEIERNDFTDLNADGDIEAAIFVGGYEEFGDHTVTLNNFNDGFVERFNGAQPGFDPDDADTLSAECNYWGHATGPEDEDNPQGKGQGVLGPVDYRPWSVRKIGRGENPEKSCVGGKNDDRGNGNGNGRGN